MQPAWRAQASSTTTPFLVFWSSARVTNEYISSCKGGWIAGSRGGRCESVYKGGGGGEERVVGVRKPGRTAKRRRQPAGNGRHVQSCCPPSPPTAAALTESSSSSFRLRCTTIRSRVGTFLMPCSSGGDGGSGGRRTQETHQHVRTNRHVWCLPHATTQQIDMHFHALLASEPCSAPAPLSPAACVPTAPGSTPPCSA